MMVRSTRKEFWLLALTLIVVTFAAYQSVWHAGFIWDDDDHLTANPVMIMPDGLQKIWSSRAASRYYPLTLTTFWVERRLWGLNPLPYHLVNIAFHSINAVLAFSLLRRLRVPGAWWAALLWAVHPVNVESAAWVTEMKNTQSGLFFFLALLCYLRPGSAEPHKQAQHKWYALSIICGAAAMLSKSSTVILPLVLLLCTWWEHRRLRVSDIDRAVPFFIMALAMSLLTISEQQHYVRGAGVSEWSLGIGQQLILAGKAIWFYAVKLVWPTNLMFVYPRWELNARAIADWLPLIGVIGVGAVLYANRRKPWAKTCLFGLGYFVSALLPVLGFFEIYYFRYSFVADHFQYLASLGIIALMMSGIVWAAGRRSLPKAIEISVCALLAVTLGSLTWRQGRIYRDEETLFSSVLMQNPRCWMAHNNLGRGLMRAGKLSEAIGHFEHALRLRPDDEEIHFNLGQALWQAGDTRAATAQWQTALQLKPAFPEAHNNLGVALAAAGRLPEAIGHWEQSLRLRSDDATTHYNLGLALAKLGRASEAIEHWEQALRIQPDLADAQKALARLRAAQ